MKKRIQSSNCSESFNILYRCGFAILYSRNNNGTVKTVPYICSHLRSKEETGQPTTADAVNRLQYSRLARYSLRNTPYCAQSFLFPSSSTGRGHKRSPSLFAEANRDDRLRITCISFPTEHLFYLYYKTLKIFCNPLLKKETIPNITARNCL